MRIYLFIPIIIALFNFFDLIGQSNVSLLSGRDVYDNSFQDQPRDESGLRIVFYNVENLFDPFDDTLKHDDEYTMMGFRGWSWKKFQAKVINTARVLINVGGWEPPGIIGLCEVENGFALHYLKRESPLKKFNYKSVHYESPDKRGIDVALLYRDEKFESLYDEAIQIIFPFDTSSRTRDILYVKGLVTFDDTLHVFVNHWPSRYGGYLGTKPKREYVSSVLRQKVDSILSFDSLAYIVIMGDFNDDPAENSIYTILKAKSLKSNATGYNLINLMYDKHMEGKEGTHKFREHWGILDQFIVSSSFLRDSSNIKIMDNKAIIFSPAFLLMDDPQYLGLKTFRTYHGAKYQGGYSDHLPVYLDLIFR